MFLIPEIFMYVCSLLCGALLKGSDVVGGELVPLKAKFTQETFVPGGDE